MKNVIIIGVLVLIGLGIWWTLFQEPVPAKEYRLLKKTVIEPEMQSIDNPMKNLVKWKLDIESCETSGNTAIIHATEVQYRMPKNAAALNFATIITSKLKVTMEKVGDEWRLTKEDILDKKVSTYDDRKK